ncbi:histidinol-phosphate transaminase [Arthrobacter antibioticus]|uniref:histidinol-phosphate transaminase n=1 Tax=Arthrobacter sp. H35-MC1 TaxID=3046203 RepID=UPI0024BAFD18|nr:histidinol-phosphate transaminase [Arthrobacter sp. H35-MC1]MDJ0318523.1 histidinol-phosphate transaminase [Arthrobacter sp. H35-MC1]
MTETNGTVHSGIQPGVHPGIQPRPVVGRLPKYVAGKPPEAVSGLESFKLSSNENPLGPVPAVLEVLRGTLDVHRYPDTSCTLLRNALSNFLDVPADDVVTGAGSLGALNQILAAFAGQNSDGSQDEVVYAWRSFEAYPICVGLAGAKSVQVPVRADGSHDLDAMAAAVTKQTKVVLLCTPNNPTGPVLGSQESESFIQSIPSDVVIVIDEAYQEFVRAEDALNGVDLYRKYPNVLVLRTFSKAHGLAGLRVGYSISQPSITGFLRSVATPFAVSGVAEQAAVASLENYDQVVERVQSLVDERTRVVAGLTDLGWDIPDAQGNFVWLNLGTNSQEFAALAQSHALSLRAFGDEGVRVTIGEAEANTRFLEICTSYTKEPRRS